MKASFVFWLFVCLCGFTEGLVREHIFLNSKMNWTDSQQHCRRHYRDLFTITTEEDNEVLRNTFTQTSWIGLYRSQPNSNSWLWSDGEAVSVFGWKSGQPNNFGQSQHCVMIEEDGWNDSYCWQNLTFFCERILVLVKENKTWEEAYEYCRAQYTGLAFLSSETQLSLAKKETKETQTVSVWTGLRFLAGEWLWVNGEPLGSLVSLPSCPAEPYRCGARNSKMDVWENRDCEEKLNFLCY